MSKKKQQNALDLLDKVIEAIAANIRGYVKNPEKDFTRKRMLDAVTFLKVLLNMQGGSLEKELLDAFPVFTDRMSVSAFIQAKNKILPELLVDLLKMYNDTLVNPKKLDSKYRLFAIDGSSFCTPYNPDSEFTMKDSERTKKNGEKVKSFCQFHANLLYDLLNRSYQDCVVQPRAKNDERSAAIEMLERLDNAGVGPYIVVMDRGYESFNQLAHLSKLTNGKYIVRVKAGSGAIREIANLPDKACDVDMTFKVTTSLHYYNQHKDEEPNLHYVIHHNKQYKAVRSPKTKDQRWDFGQIHTIKCRVVKFRINDADSGKEQWEVLITNLERPEFPLMRMKEMYRMRWDIETSFRELKHALSAVNFHSKKDDFVKLELFSRIIMFNVVSRCISRVAILNFNRKYSYSIDFKMSCMLVNKYFRLHNTEPPDRIYIELGMYTNPIRPGRKGKRDVRPQGVVWYAYRAA